MIKNTKRFMIIYFEFYYEGIYYVIHNLYGSHNIFPILIKQMDTVFENKETTNLELNTFCFPNDLPELQNNYVKQKLLAAIQTKHKNTIAAEDTKYKCDDKIMSIIKKTIQITYFDKIKYLDTYVYYNKQYNYNVKIINLCKNIHEVEMNANMNMNAIMI